MIDPVETEIKLASSATMLDALRSHPLLAGTATASSFTTTYFDTVDGRLRHRSAALRIRDTGGNRQQTLKIAAAGAGGVRRREWNVPAAPDGPPRPGDFPPRARAALLRMLDGAPLEPIAEVRTDRTVHRLRHGHSVIEAAFDQAWILAGGRREEVFELELELVEGHLKDAIDLALGLPLGAELHWSIVGKAGRAHALAFDLAPEVVRARPVTFSMSTNVAQGFQAVAWSCLEQLLADYPLVVAAANPAALHQCRVAIRRLRAVLNLFKDIADDPEMPVHKAELKAVADGLGLARELFVLTRQAETAAKRADQDAAALLEHLARRRTDANAVAQELLAGAEFQHLLLQLARWIEGGAWLEHGDATLLSQPLALFAAKQLDRRTRKMRRAGRKLARMDDAARHRLRIEVKKLRYAAEFFAPLFDDPEARKRSRDFAAILARLQDGLGELNDMAVAAAGHAALFAGVEPIVAAGLEAQLCELLAIDRKTHRKLLKMVRKALSRIEDLPRWWKGGQRGKLTA